MKLEWLKKHPYAAAGGGLALLVIFYLLYRHSSSSSGSGLSGAIAQQNQGQLQMAQLNAQLDSQSSQTQAQLAAQEYATQAQEQMQQTQLVGQLAGTLIPAQMNSNLYEQELLAQEHQQAAMLPLEQTAMGQVGQGGSLETAGLNELSLLSGQGMAGGLSNLPGGNHPAANPGLNMFLGGLGTSLGTLGAGVFG